MNGGNFFCNVNIWGAGPFRVDRYNLNNYMESSGSATLK